MKKLLSIAFIIFLLAGCNSQKQDDFPVLSGPYLGQKPPSITPEIFAPGIISTDFHEFGCCFSPDGKEFYFTRKEQNLKRNVIMSTKIINGIWTKPEIVSFIGDYMAFEPRITPKGDRLYFTLSRPLLEGGPSLNIWYVERQNGEWGLPQNPGDPFNPMKTMYISVAANGTIYTNDISESMETQSIGVIKPLKSGNSKIERLGPPVNIGKRERYPFVAPDESYLIFCSDRIDGNLMRLFVSFRKEDGEWSQPKLINLGMKAILPLVSPDRKYLFFSAGKPYEFDIYWVDARIIDTLKPKNLH